MDVKEVKVKAIRSDGLKFEYQNADWGIVSLEGIDFSPVEIFKSNKGYGHGDIITGKRKGARDINIVAVSRNARQNSRDRSLAVAFHNANYTFDVIVTYMGVTRIAKNCEIQGAKCPSGNVYKRQELTVSFLAPDADLFSDVSDMVDFVDATPLWHVTRVYTEGGSLPYGSIEVVTTKTIEYLGSEPTPFKATIVACGYVENMNISDGNAACHVECELSEGDILIIDAESRNVTLNGDLMPVNKYDAVGLQDLKINCGINNIVIEADDPGNVAFQATINYTGRYGGL